MLRTMMAAQNTRRAEPAKCLAAFVLDSARRFDPVAILAKPLPGRRVRVDESVVACVTEVNADTAKKVFDPALLAGVSAAGAGN